MGSAWHEVSALGRPATRWGSLLAMLLVAACGGDRDAAPAGDRGSVATVDTATTAPAAPTADKATPPATSDTAASGGDTAAGAKQPSATAKPPKPASSPAPKPAAPKPAPTQPQQAAQDTSQATPPPADAPLRDAYHQAPRDTVDQATYDGWKQFNLNCARCHGEDVLGTTIAPHLIVSLKPDGPIKLAWRRRSWVISSLSST